MLRVRVRFNKIEEKKTIRIDGFAEEYPEVGKKFSFFTRTHGAKCIIDLGTVYNIKSYGDMLLVQFEFLVAEVWLLGGELEQQGAEIYPFLKSRNSLFLKGGKLQGLKKAGASFCPRSLIKLICSLADRDALFSNKPFLRLIKGEKDPC